MSQKLFTGEPKIIPPRLQMINSGASTITCNATGEKAHFIGDLWLENPAGGSKTISSAGGGSIVWRAGGVTFANGGSTFKVGIQDVSAANTPAQGDGTFDVEASFTGGGGGITATAWNTSVMTSGTKTLAHGDAICIAFEMTAAGGADSVSIAKCVGDFTLGWPCTMENLTGSWVRSSGRPLAYIVFDDGSKGAIFGGGNINGSSQVSVNSGSSPDEYGNLINIPIEFIADGIELFGTIPNNADFELILYSDGLGTPVAEKTVTVDATMLGNTTSGRIIKLFPSSLIMKPNRNYVVAIRPTTANNVTISYIDTNTVAGGGTFGPPNSYYYAVNRTNQSGAFADYNGGTAKTRLMQISVVGQYLDQGINKGNLHIGI